MAELYEYLEFGSSKMENQQILITFSRKTN